MQSQLENVTKQLTASAIDKFYITCQICNQYGHTALLCPEWDICYMAESSSDAVSTTLISKSIQIGASTRVHSSIYINLIFPQVLCDMEGHAFLTAIV